MRLFKGLVFVTLICGLIFILGLCGHPVHADYEFGRAEKLGTQINSSENEWLASLSLDGLNLRVSRNTAAGQETWVFTRLDKDTPWDTGVRKDNLPREQWTGSPSEPGRTTLDGLEGFGWGPFDGTYGGYDIYTMKRESTDIPWGECDFVNLGPVVNTSNGEALVTVSSDGLDLYFSDYELHRPGGYGEEDLWVTHRATRDSPWETPENLGPVVNSPANDSRAHISIDGLMLFFDSRRPGGHGGSDLYVTKRKTRSDPWGTPTNLGLQVSSSGNEWTPCISPDGCELYFDRNEDIWRATVHPVVDFTGDYRVDIEDLLILIEHWGQSEPTFDMGPMPWGDGVVDAADLEVLMSYWGQEVFDPHLLAHWKLDESEGDIASGGAMDNDASVIGNATWLPDSGQAGGAIQLDGEGSYIEAPHILNPADGVFGAFAWVMGGAPGQVILSQENGADWLMLDAQGNLKTSLKGGTRLPDLNSGVMLSDDTWYRVGFVWDGESRALYIDDVEVTRDPQTAMEESQGGMYIGAGADLADGTFWSGLIDDVRIYDRAVEP